MDHLDEGRFKITLLEHGCILSAIVYSRALKRNILLCIWESEDRKVRKLYFSTDTKMEAIDVFDCYRTRFQIEFSSNGSNNTFKSKDFGALQRMPFEYRYILQYALTA